jgi:hypothetical protein
LHDQFHDLYTQEVPELFGDQIKKNDVCRTCGTHGNEMRTGLWFEKT